MGFKKATKAQAKLRMAIHGPSGSGKTRSALEIGRHLGTRIALVDTERGSASKYANYVDFDVQEVYDNYHPNRAIKAMEEAAGEAYDVLIVDSLSHFWNGPSGFLELVDEEVKKMRARGGKADSFAAWKEIDPIYRRLMQAILACPMHVIVTMRAKQEYVKEQDDRGKTTIRKVGMAPEMRDAAQYEFDVEGMLDIDHNLVIGKTRCDELDGKVFNKPGRDVADILKRWLSDGAPAVASVPERKEERTRTSSRAVPERAPVRDDGPGSAPQRTVAPPVDAMSAETGLADDLITGILDAANVEHVRESMQGATGLPQALRERVLVEGVIRLIDLAEDEALVDAVYQEARAMVSSNLVGSGTAKARIKPAIDARKAALSQAAA